MDDHAILDRYLAAHESEGKSRECDDCGEQFVPTRPNNVICPTCKGHKAPSQRMHDVVGVGIKHSTRRG